MHEPVCICLCRLARLTSVTVWHICILCQEWDLKSSDSLFSQRITKADVKSVFCFIDKSGLDFRAFTWHCDRQRWSEVLLLLPFALNIFTFWICSSNLIWRSLQNKLSLLVLLPRFPSFSIWSIYFGWSVEKKKVLTCLHTLGVTENKVCCAMLRFLVEICDFYPAVHVYFHIDFR